MIKLFKVVVKGSQFGGLKLERDGTIIDDSITKEYSVVAYKKDQAIKRAEKQFHTDCADIINRVGGFAIKTEVVDEQTVLIW